MDAMHEIREEVLLYIKQNYPKGAMLYTSVPERFSQVSKRKRVEQQKVIAAPPPREKVEKVEEVFTPPAPKKSFEIEKREVEKTSFSSDFRSFYEKMSLPLRENNVVVFSHPKLGHAAQLLQNLAQAINTKCSPCRLIDLSKSDCENFRFALIPKSLLDDYPQLKSYDNTLILDQLEEMQTSVEKKKALWELITQKIKS